MESKSTVFKNSCLAQVSLVEGVSRSGSALVAAIYATSLPRTTSALAPLLFHYAAGVAVDFARVAGHEAASSLLRPWLDRVSLIIDAALLMLMAVSVFGRVYQSLTSEVKKASLYV